MRDLRGRGRRTAGRALLDSRGFGVAVCGAPQRRVSAAAGGSGLRREPACGVAGSRHPVEATRSGTVSASAPRTSAPRAAAAAGVLFVAPPATRGGTPILGGRAPPSSDRRTSLTARGAPREHPIGPDHATVVHAARWLTTPQAIRNAPPTRRTVPRSGPPPDPAASPKSRQSCEVVTANVTSRDVAPHHPAWDAPHGASPMFSSSVTSRATGSPTTVVKSPSTRATREAPEP